MTKPALSYSDGAPPGHSGAFGEPDCGACHSAAESMAPAPDVELGGLLDRINAGASYRLTLRLSTKGLERAGFQLTVRGPGGAVVGHLQAIDDLSRVDLGPPEVLVHTEAGTRPEGFSSVLWKFKWTAPIDLPETINFAIAALVANNDDSSFGDNVFLYRISVSGRP